MKILDKPLMPMWQGIVRIHQTRSATRLHYFRNSQGYKDRQSRRYWGKAKNVCQCGCGRKCVNRYLKGHYEKSEENRERMREDNPAFKIKFKIKHSGESHHNWHGGKVIVDGYLYIYSPTHPKSTKLGYVLEHRLEMEKKLKRYLSNEEIVHHIDGNKMNNNINNLELMDLSSHSASHYGERQINSKGRFCDGGGQFP